MTDGIRKKMVSSTKDAEEEGLIYKKIKLANKRTMILTETMYPWN